MRVILLDEVVAALDRGAKARVGVGHLFLEEAGHQTLALGAQEREPFFCCARGRLVIQILGRGAEHDVAVDGGADKHAFAEFAGYGKYDLVQEIAGELVEDQQFTPSWRDGEAVVPKFPVERVRTQPGGVDEPPRGDVALVRA